MKRLWANSNEVFACLDHNNDGRRGLVVWFTGLSGAGKTTLAVAVQNALAQEKHRTFLLDGDRLRKDLCSDLGFSLKDRSENIRRAGIVSKYIAESGLICLAALISPFRADRLQARKQMAEGFFLEVYVNATLEVCEKRDTKGLYKKARAGQISEFTGISSPYEAPISPELEIKSDFQTVPESVDLVLKAIHARLAIRR